MKRWTPELATFVVGAALAAPSGCSSRSTGPDLPKGDNRLDVEISLLSWVDAVNEGRFPDAEAAFVSTFRHEGEGRDDVVGWLRDLRSQVDDASRLSLSVTGLEIAVHADSDPAANGATATARFELIAKRCPSASAGVDAGAEADAAGAGDACTTLDDRTFVPFGDHGWMSHLEKVDSVWRFVGDQRPIGVRIASLNDGGVVTLDLSVRDRDGQLTGVSLDGPFASGLALTRAADGRWQLPAEVVLASDAGHLPELPLRYRFTFAPAVEPPVTYELGSIVRDFATPLAPVGESELPPSFSWSASVAGAPRYRVDVHDGAALLWRSAIVRDAQTPYRGPALTPGKTYQWSIAVLDPAGDASFNHASFVALAPGTVSPSIASLSLTSGPAAGGQAVTITGGGFRAGDRVLFGEAEAGGVDATSDTTLRCVTPSVAAGVVNVVVIDRSGRAAVLEKGYQYLP